MPENTLPTSGADSEPATPANVVRDGLTIAQTAESVGVCKQTIYNEINAGRLIARKMGSRTIILNDDRHAWLAALPTLKTEAA